jgi:hypothetical protein
MNALMAMLALIVILLALVLDAMSSTGPPAAVSRGMLRFLIRAALCLAALAAVLAAVRTIVPL